MAVDAPGYRFVVRLTYLYRMLLRMVFMYQQFSYLFVNSSPPKAAVIFFTELIKTILMMYVTLINHTTRQMYMYMKIC